jgi:hypothetical protein
MMAAVKKDGGDYIMKLRRMAAVAAASAMALSVMAVNASAAEYEVRVYDKTGTKLPSNTVTVAASLAANDWYTIKVVPLQPLSDGEQKSVKLHIIYTPSWMIHADYLLINGEQESPAYLSSGTDPDAIIITQIEQQPYN